MLKYTSRIDPAPSSPYYALSSLSLLSPNLRSTPVYTSLLSSSHWASSHLTRQQLLGEDIHDDGRVNAGHRVIPEAYGSTGCVNAMDWEEGGKERLVSAGDDTKVCIWTPGHVKGHEREDQEGVFPGFGLTETIETGHRANIFSVKWAPQNENSLFTCAGDSEARVFDISHTSNPSLISTLIRPSPASPFMSCPLPWTHHTSSACTRVIQCHTSRVKRISTEPFSPSIFLTCSEDGTVRQHDLRQTHTCRPASRFGRQRGEGCPMPLADYSSWNFDLYSLSLSKIQPHLFVVAGTSPFAYLHDRRMVRTPMIKEWSVSPQEGQLTQCVRRFGVPKEDPSELQTKEGKGFIKNHIVAVKMSPTNSRDLLVSYSEKGIYRFDIHSEEFRFEPTPSTKKARNEEEEEGGGKYKRRRSEENEENGGGREVPSTPIEGVRGNTKEELVRPRKRAEEERVGVREEDEESSADVNEGSVEFEGGQELGVDESGEEEEDDEGDGSWEDEEEEEEEPSQTDFDTSSDASGSPSSPFSPTSRAASLPNLSIPLIAPIAHYAGHANSQTVKDVNFAFEGKVVVSGSDDGNWFAWDLESEKCLGIWKGDSSVVNVLMPHPRLPLVAISGIDNQVSIYGPISDRNRVDAENLVGEYEAIKKRNERDAGRRMLMPTVLPDALLRLLATRGGLHVQEEGEEGGGEEGAGVRIFFDDPSGTGERRAADCSIM